MLFGWPRGVPLWRSWVSRPFRRFKKRGRGFGRGTEQGCIFSAVQEAEGKKALAPEYIENQKALDAALISGLDATVKSYLGSRFTLKSGDRPHLMKF